MSRGMGDDFMRALGNVTYSSVCLEHIVKLLVEGLLRCSDIAVAQCVTADLSFRGAVDLARALHKTREASPCKQEQLAALLARCLHAEERRNVLVHSLWAPGDDDAQYVRLKATGRKGALRWQCEVFPVPDMEQVASDSHQVGVELWAFMQENEL